MKYKHILLDRDGVINRNALPHSYITSWKEFEFLPGVLEGFKEIAQKGYVFSVITNQRGVARGAMSLADLNEIHRKMIREVGFAGIRLEVYACPHEAGTCSCRKPSPNMIIQAALDRGIALEESIFFGDSFSDYEAAKNVRCEFGYIDTLSCQREETLRKFSKARVNPWAFRNLYSAFSWLSQ